MKHTLRYEPIPATFYQANRDKLAASLPAGALVIVHANDIYPTNADGTLAHHQNANLFYLTGIVLMDIFALAVSGIYAHVGDKIWDMSLLYAGMGTYLNMSLFLGYATLYPSAQFLLMFIIPVRAWIFALFDLAITFYDVFSMAEYFPHNLLPLVAIANYFLFFGKEVLNVFPISWRVGVSRLFGRKPKTVRAKVVPFPSAGSYQATVATPKAPYTHKCVVCGKTDISDPDMEFRYCSRCKGYHCYCIDHINNHEHIEE